MSVALIIFIKNPIEGKVKTRLGRVVGEDEALRIYLELCKLTRKCVDDFPGVKYLFYSDEIISADEWSEESYNKQKQQGKDLGERMLNAFKLVFSQHNRIIIIGSDCPYLKKSHLLQALETLEKVNCVIGPARDGGYYLLGLNKMIPELFKDKRWSSKYLFAETLDTLKELNHSVSFLEALEDIDDISDWERYKISKKIEGKNA